MRGWSALALPKQPLPKPRLRWHPGSHHLPWKTPSWLVCALHRLSAAGFGCEWAEGPLGLLDGASARLRNAGAA